MMRRAGKLIFRVVCGLLVLPMVACQPVSTDRTALALVDGVFHLLAISCEGEEVAYIATYEETREGRKWSISRNISGGRYGEKIDIELFDLPKGWDLKNAGLLEIEIASSYGISTGSIGGGPRKTILFSGSEAWGLDDSHVLVGGKGRVMEKSKFLKRANDSCK